MNMFVYSKALPLLPFIPFRHKNSFQTLKNSQSVLSNYFPVSWWYQLKVSLVGYECAHCTVCSVAL